MFENDTIFYGSVVAPGSAIPSWQNQSTDTTEKMESITFPLKQPVTSFFTAHNLRARGISPGSYIRPQPDWIAVLLILCFILLAWVQVFDRHRLSQIIRAPFQKRFFNQLIREGNLFAERISLILGIIYFICLILLVYLGYTMLLGSPPFNIGGFYFFLAIGICLVFYWAVKVFIIRLLGKVFRTSQTTREYMINILVFNLISGLMLLPLLVLIIYLQSIYLLYIGLIITALVILLRFLRGFLIGTTLTKFSYLYLFVYLCSLEILPLIVLLRVFLNQIHIAIRIH